MTTTETRTVKILRTEVKAQKEQITGLMMRINSLADEISGLQSDIERFKGNVAADVKYLTGRVDQ